LLGSTNKPVEGNVVDVFILLIKLPVLLVMILIIYVLPIALLLASSARFIFDLGHRKWLALAIGFCLPLSIILITTKVKALTFSMQNTGLYIAILLVLIAVFFWYKAIRKTENNKYWLEVTSFFAVSIFWLIFMATTTKWIVG